MKQLSWWSARNCQCGVTNLPKMPTPKTSRKAKSWTPTEHQKNNNKWDLEGLIYIVPILRQRDHDANGQVYP